MKILLLYPSWPGRAVGNVDRDSLQAHVTKLASTLSQQGHEVGVQKMCDDPLQRMGSTIRKLDEHCSQDQPDLVHAHLWTSGLAALATLRQSAIAEHVPIIQTFHTLDTTRSEPASRVRKWLRLKAAVARSVDQLTASSEREKADLLALGARHSAISVIPHAVDTDVFAPNGSCPNRTSPKQLVVAGPMSPETGFDVAIHALARLPNAELVIAANAPAGESSEWSLAEDHEAKRLTAIAERLHVSDRVKLIEAPAQPHLPQLLHSADVVLCTPWRNMPGTTAIEAMASGRPVVATAVGELRDIVIEGTTGVLVPPRDPHALARELHELLEDPVRLEGFGFAAAERAHIWHSWNRVGKAIADTYDRVLTGAN